ncbi:MAG: NAD-binding protein [Bryobacterales bacterium]|nr:NAD-binding protein [Bryobacterales bacterium]
MKGQKMLNDEFEAEARLAQHRKDVGLILESGREVGARLPLSAVHFELLREAERMGLGAADNSASIKVFGSAVGAE